MRQGENCEKHALPLGLISKVSERVYSCVVFDVFTKTTWYPVPGRSVTFVTVYV